MNRDDRWIADHFEELVDRYAGLYVAVVDERVVSTGEEPRRVEQEALDRQPGRRPSVIRVPKEEDMVCLL